MSPSAPEGEPSTESLREAALAPLRFVSRNRFAHVLRVANLSATLQDRLARLQAAAPTDPLLPGLLARAAALPAKTPEAEPDLGRYIEELSALERELVGWRPPADGGRPTPPPPALPRDDRAARPPPTQPLAQAASLGLAAQKKSPMQTGRGAPPLVPASSVQQLGGVGPRMGASLASRGIESIEQLLRFLPRRFRSKESVELIAELQIDSLVTVEGQVQAVREQFLRGRRQLEVILTDGSSSLSLIWFRVPGSTFKAQFVRGARFSASGTVRRHRARCQLVHPEIRRLEDIGELAHRDEEARAGQATPNCEAEVVPLYLEVEGVHPNALRRLIALALPSAALLADPLPAWLVERRQLPGLAASLERLHAPPDDSDLDALESRRDPSFRRLIYEELFLLQLGLLSRRQQHEHKERAPTVSGVGLAELAKELLPFVATAGQQRALCDIERDLRAGVPMQRLLQGDVGSGKTAVALVAALAMARMGQQTAIMVPTELLAEQHARSAGRMFRPLGVDVELLTSSTSSKERRRILARLRGPDAFVIVGTQALIAQPMAYARLGLAVVDEQHRFGVLQRARLAELGRAGQGLVPHVLVMTATPIPRTLALTVYGDLAVSVLRELPPGRLPVTTRLFFERDRAAAYAAVRAEVERGRQVYVVFPLVTASDKEGMAEVRAATESANELAAGYLSGLRLALLHGQISAADKEALMRRFVDHEIDVLIATTVVEVGLDVANATVMVIEHAERFGLSQLHQLRGRVGRGGEQSYCLLLTRARKGEGARRRLQIMCDSNDGFLLAQEDLLLRGPGDFLGTRQSGLPLLSLADLTRDQDLLESARADAAEVLAKDPGLSRPEHAATKEALLAWQQRGRRLEDVG